MTKSSRHFYTFLILRGLLFTVFLNSLEIYTFFSAEPQARYLYNGIDEIVYLPRSIKIAQGKSPHSYYYEHDVSLSTIDILTSQPSALLDWSVGSLALLFGLSPLCLGFVLDLLFGCVSYCVVCIFFKTFTEHQMNAEVATLVALLFPFHFALERYLQLPVPFPQIFTSSVLGQTSGLPVVRGIYTQVSYPLYFGALALLTRSLKIEGSHINSLFVSGILGGLLLLIYFFAWGSFAVIASGMLLFDTLLRRETIASRLRQLFSRCSRFFSGFLLGSLFGLYVMAVGTYTTKNYASAEFTRYWYFSSELLIQLIISLLFLFIARRDRGLKLLCMIDVVCFICQLALMNLQPLLATFISPFRFVQLYLNPIVAGSIGLALAEWLRRFPLTRRLRISLCIVLGMAVGFKYFDFHKFDAQHDHRSADVQLITHIQYELPEDAVIALITFSFPFTQEMPQIYSWRAVPLYLNLATGRYVLHQGWMVTSEITAEENFKRELLLGWLYSSRLQLQMPCPLHVDLPGDLYFMTWTAHQIFREVDCKRAQSILQKENTCDLLKELKVDYVLVESDFPFSPPAAAAQFFQRRWQSTDGRYTLYSFSQQDAREAVCASTNKHG